MKGLTKLSDITIKSREKKEWKVKKEEEMKNSDDSAENSFFNRVGVINKKRLKKKKPSNFISILQKKEVSTNKKDQLRGFCSLDSCLIF